MNNDTTDYTAKNKETLKTLVKALDFSFISKCVTFPWGDDHDYVEVICEESELVGWYTMVSSKIDIADMDVPMMNTGMPQYDDEESKHLAEIKEHWIPLPVLMELLDMDIDVFLNENGTVRNERVSGPKMKKRILAKLVELDDEVKICASSESYEDDALEEIKEKFYLGNFAL